MTAAAVGDEPFSGTSRRHLHGTHAAPATCAAALERADTKSNNATSAMKRRCSCELSKPAAPVLRLQRRKETAVQRSYAGSFFPMCALQSDSRSCYVIQTAETHQRWSSSAKLRREPDCTPAAAGDAQDAATDLSERRSFEGAWRPVAGGLLSLKGAGCGSDRFAK